MAPPLLEPGTISPLLSTALSILYTTLYVGIIYLSPVTRPRPGLSRNDPFVIRTRIRGVTLVTLFSVAATSLLVYTCTPNSWGGTLQALGLSHPTGVETVAAVLLTGVLFAGPLVERAVEWEVEGLVDGRLTMVGWRNYVVAPLTEEIVFRACMVPLMLLGGVSAGRTVILTPLVFGIAHFHHAYEFLLNYPGHVKMAVLSSVAQFAYTTLFGWYATFVLIRTGSVWPAVAVHTFCNFMGAPSLVITGPGWLRTVYYPLLVGGAYGFYVLLWPLTESANALASFT